jgi:muramoyltetrapeptide carboxypeptidase LdcA involved in peptidoglycan recycling
LGRRGKEPYGLGMEFVVPRKLRTGDRIAVVSPSNALGELLPLPYQLGVKRLREEFGLEVVEYPTTLKMRSSPQARAADLMAAFGDPSVRAVIASIGGDDQITVIPHLDPEVVRADPKPFFGSSDNTNLLAWLWSLGIVSYHGPTVMVQFGRPGAMHPLVVESFRAAAFGTGDASNLGAGEFELRPVSEFGDRERDWADPVTFDAEPEMFPAEGWVWRGDIHKRVEGVAWGGCIEVLAWLLMADRTVPAADAVRGGVFFFESSEEMPPAEEVYRILRNMGERGLLGAFDAILAGRPKTEQVRLPRSEEERRGYAREQMAAVDRAVAEYAPHAVLVHNVDFGHTDPQFVIPMGGQVRVDGPARRITVAY